MTNVANSWRGVTEDDHSRAVVVVDEGPKVTACAHHGPLGDDVLPGMGVALQFSIFLFWKTLLSFES